MHGTRIVAISFAAALSLTLVGCSTSTGESGETPAATESAPTRSIVVGIDPTLRPLKYVDDDDETAGFVVDLINAAADELNYEITYERMAFDALIPAVQAGRVDMVASMGDIPDRRPTITFIDYLRSGAVLMVPDENAADINGPENLCGLEVAFAKGSAQQTVTEEADQACLAQGDPRIVMGVYPSGSEAVLALRSGQADAAWTDLVAGAYLMDQSPNTFDIAYTDEGYGYGIGFPIADTELLESFFDALVAVREAGTYDELLEKHGLNDATLEEFTINNGEGPFQP